MIKRLRIRKADIFSLLVCWIWVQTFLVKYVRAIVMRLPIIGEYADILITLVFVLIIVVAIPCYRMKKSDLFFIFIVVCIFVFQWGFYKETQEYMDHYIVSFLFKILPLYIVGVSFTNENNQEDIIRKMYILSMITLIADIFYKLYIGSPMSEVASRYEGDMDRAYKILPHCCLIAYYAITKTNLWNGILIIVGGLYLLLLGTRGAAMIYLLFVTVLLIKGRKSKGRIVRVAIISGTAFAFFMSPLYKSTLFFLYQTAQKTGLSVRFFDKLLFGSFTESSGRDAISEILLNAIAKKPVLGYGICGDRILAGNYAHNIAVELWISFGVFVGTAILVAIVFVLIYGYRRANNGKKVLILVLFFSSFCMLFLSGSYLDNRLLMLLLGLCVGSIRERGLNFVKEADL